MLKTKFTEPFTACLYGEIGSGKTWGLTGLLDLGLKVRLLASESNALPGARKALRAYEKTNKTTVTPEMFGIAQPPRSSGGLEAMIVQQNVLLHSVVKDNMSGADPNRKKQLRYMKTLTALTDFVDVGGTKLGSVYDWGLDTVLVLDSLTEISADIMLSVCGNKLGRSQPEWGIGQSILSNFIRLLTQSLGCHVIVIAHPVRSEDKLAGGTTSTKIYPQSIGVALNHNIPSLFSEVIYSTKTPQGFFWSTKHNQAISRNTMLPLSSNLPQDWGMLLTTNHPTR